MKIFLISILSGMISGMGIGGGTLLIPSLIIFGGLDQKQAQGINLISFIPIASVALITHYINKNIDTKIAKPLIFSGIIGAIIGSLITLNISSHILKKMFGVFLFCIGIYEIINSKK